MISHTKRKSQPRFPDDAFLAALRARELPLRLEFVLSSPGIEMLPPSDAAEIAIVGRSNTGKSTLLNFIAGQRQLARASSTPGRTQLINLFDVERGAFAFADLPGYGYAEAGKELRRSWAENLRGYFEGRPNLVGVLFLVDVRRDLGAEDERLHAWFEDLGLATAVIQTKCDKVTKAELPLRRRAQAVSLKVAAEKLVSTSAEKRSGLRELFIAVEAILHEARQGADGAE